MADRKTRIIDSPFRESSDLPQWYERLSFSSAGNHKDLLNVKFVGSGRDGGLSLGSRLSESGQGDSWFKSPLEIIGGPPRLRRPRVGHSRGSNRRQSTPARQAAEHEDGVLGLVAIPIPTPHEELTSLVSRYYRELGAASDERIAWRLIDDPRLHDDVYHRQRTPEMQRADEVSISAFIEAAYRAGSRDRYVVREYWEAVIYFGLQPRDVPVILLVAQDPVMALASLHIDRRAFEDRRREAALKELLVNELSQDALMRFAHGGRFTRSSMKALQRHFVSVERRVRQVAAMPLLSLGEEFPTVTSAWERKGGASSKAPTYALAHSRDYPCVALTKEGYARIANDRGSCNVVIDGITLKSYRRNLPRIVYDERALTSAEFEMLRGFVTTGQVQRPTRFYLGRSDDPKAASKIFQTARQKVDVKRKRGSWLMFRAHRNMTGQSWSYEFAPPADVNWMLIQRVDE